MRAIDPEERATPLVDVDELRAQVGREIGVSSWHEIDQARVDAFAEATEDPNYVHVDPARAAAHPLLDGPIAHGFLTLSLLSAFGYEVMPRIAGAELGLNYGLERARFVTPVPVGARVRGRFVLKEMRERPGAAVICYAVTVEIEGSDRPALVADWLTLAKLPEAGR